MSEEFDDEDFIPEDPENSNDDDDDSDEEFEGLVLVRTSSCETIIGIYHAEDDDKLVLMFPMKLGEQMIRHDGVISPMIFLVRYTPGLWKEILPLNKTQLIFSADVDDEIEEFYFKMLPRLYPETATPEDPGLDPSFVVTAEDELLMTDNEVDEEVTKSVNENPDETLDQMIERLVGKSTKH